MPPFRVLFVCIGNICRSPLGERLLAAALPAGEFEVTSAGVRGLTGWTMDLSAAEQLIRLGGDPGGFKARRLTEAMVADADLVLTATRLIRSDVLTESPGALARTFTVREFAELMDVIDARGADESLRDLIARAARHRSLATGDPDIPDPYGQSLAEHEVAAELMALAVDRIVEAFTT